MLTRRDFCKYLATVSVGALVFDPSGLRFRALASGYFGVTELGPDRWVFTGGGGNVLLLKNAGKPLLIDAGVGAIASELLEKVTGRISKKSCTLINTHHHADHIGGNYIMRHGFETNVSIIAQENLAPRIASTLDESIRPTLLSMAEASDDKDADITAANALTADDFAPTDTFTDERELRTGDMTAHLFHYGAGHTDNDTVVFLPRENILHMGDLIFNDLHPYVIAEHGATIGGWRNSLAKAMDLCNEKTVVIPGHGEIGDRTALQRMDTYFAQATHIVAEAIKDGKTREDVSRLKPEIFAERGFADVQHMTLVRIYDELTGA
jgi:cyclase